jgi:hypothetical protein
METNKGIKIGFTGTRSGMSKKQEKETLEILDKHNDNIDVTIHGGCVGADMDFHTLCEAYVRWVYPGHFNNRPFDTTYRGEYEDADFIADSETHFKRNRAIVDDSDLMIATPYNNNQKGGTWYTINYAKKVGKKVIILDR